MNGRLLALAGALCLLAACGRPERDWPPPSPALWEVTGPEGAQGWLFGTVHALPRGVDWRTEQLDQTIAAADVIVVEVADLGNRDRARAAFAERAHTPGLPPLSQRIGAQDRAAVRELMERSGSQDSDFASTETWAAGLLLAGAVRSGRAENGVDRALVAAGKPVTELEGFAAQFDIFDRLPAADQADLLAALAREAGEEAGEMRIEAWLTGDIETLEREALGGLMAYPRLRAALLTARNRAWSEDIAALLASGRKPLVAVGAGHLLGDEGLPALLVRRGYSLRRIQ